MILASGASLRSSSPNRIASEEEPRTDAQCRQQGCTANGPTYYLFDADNWMKVFSPFSLLGGLAFTLFELLVIFLQAYVFALLTAVYISLAQHADEH
jgi:hypothetical protein